jgi:hypothetical protein
MLDYQIKILMRSLPSFIKEKNINFFKKKWRLCRAFIQITKKTPQTIRIKEINLRLVILNNDRSKN